MICSFKCETENYDFPSIIVLSRLSIDKSFLFYYDTNPVALEFFEALTKPEHTTVLFLCLLDLRLSSNLSRSLFILILGSKTLLGIPPVFKLSLSTLLFMLSGASAAVIVEIDCAS